MRDSSYVEYESEFNVCVRIRKEKNGWMYEKFSTVFCFQLQCAHIKALFLPNLISNIY
jgi:hypothetical protein